MAKEKVAKEESKYERYEKPDRGHGGKDPIKELDMKDLDLTEDPIYNPPIDPNAGDSSEDVRGADAPEELIGDSLGEGLTLSEEATGIEDVVVSINPDTHHDDVITDDHHEPLDESGDCNHPDCAGGASYFADETSSTGYRSCLTCLEVSPIPSDETIWGDPVILIPTNTEITFDGEFHPPQTLSFNEQVKGWTSFKTYYYEKATSINNHYYTWSGGSIWQHHINPRRNNFYGVDYDSTVDIIFNDAPSSVKGFQTIKYEGSQSRINKFETVVVDGVSYTDKEYYNLWDKCGWWVDYAETDLQTGKVPEFKNKEGKWFNVIQGDCTDLENLDEREFSVQGLGFGTLTHSDPSSVNPDPPRVEEEREDREDRIVSITIKDSGFDIDGTSWD